MITNEIALPASVPVRPELVRMPKPGTVCAWTGLSRAHLYNLASEGNIKTVSLRKPGTLRGVRLIRLSSVFEYIEKMAAQAEAPR